MGFVLQMFIWASNCQLSAFCLAVDLFNKIFMLQIEVAMMRTERLTCICLYKGKELGYS